MGKTFLYVAVFVVLYIQLVRTENNNIIDLVEESRHISSEFAHSLKSDSNTELKYNENIQIAEACKCDNGKCVEKDGKSVCTCAPEFGLLKYGSRVECIACNCGKESNCTVEYGFWSLSPTITCKCKDGYKVVGKICTGPCTNNPCKNGGTCADENKTFKCICPFKYIGKLCENKNPCNPNPCDNEGTCTVKGTSFTCDCKGNYWGDKCERECICKNGHCIKDSSGNIQCVCPPEFGKYSDHFCKECDCGNEANCTFKGGFISDGKKCICPFNFKETNGKCEDACTNTPCKNGGTCEPMGKSFNCTCKEPHFGETCENGPCSTNPCQNGGECIVSGSTFKCNCKNPFNGTKCEIGPCSTNPCQNGGQCIVSESTFKCNCKNPFNGTKCEIGPCSTNPCQNGGECIVSGSTFKCNCKNPFNGTKCEIGPCSTNPCQNGGECTVSGSTFKCNCKNPFNGNKCEIGPCSTNPCQNGGECTVSGSTFKCNCKQPFNGNKCEIGPCSTNPCQNGGECIVSESTFKCNCKKPFNGNKCEIGPCSTNPCQNGGECIVSESTFKCNCKKPFNGNKCEIGPCSTNPCQNGGECIVSESIFKCNCKKPFNGNKCEIGPCSTNPCQNGGECIVSESTFKCNCKKPFNGNKCEIGPCSTNPCQNGGECIVSESTFKCNCKKPFNGNKCEIGPCSSNPCQNGGECTVLGSSFKCNCKKPFSGNQCENGPCNPNPCANGGTCNIIGTSFTCSCKDNFWGDTCKKECICEHGHCIKDSSGNVQCVCPPEFGKFSEHLCKECNCGEGANCTFVDWIVSEVKKCICPFDFKETKGGKCEDACTKTPCKNGGICQPMGKSFNCTCKQPNFGETCEKDPCTDIPCKNNGKCIIDGNSFKCDCKSPFSGKTCEEAPCINNPCWNGGTCKVDGSSFKCECKAPYSGKTCGEDPCTSTPCLHGGTCEVKENSFVCHCIEPHFGTTCEMDPCTDKPCANGGSCKLKGSSYTCDCIPPYFGSQCRLDPCTDSPCRNNGTCELTESNFKCDCESPYSGQLCEEECKCENGVCAKDNAGNLRCHCLPGYGLLRDEVCEECNCGKNVNCTFETWFLTYNKTCDCPEGYEERDGVCEEIQTTRILSTSTTTQPISKHTASSTQKSISTDETVGSSTTAPSTPTLTTELQNITEFNTTTDVPTKFTTDFNETTYSPSNFTGDFNGTTYSPSNFTFDFNGTTYSPSNFTDDFNGTTYSPSNFTGDFNGTTYSPSNFTGDFNGTTYSPSNFTGDFNGTTYSPSNFTGDFNGTTYSPSNFTEDFNGTTYSPSNFTGDFNGTTYSPSNFTEDFNGTTYSPSNFTGDFNGTTYSPSNFTGDFNGTTYSPSNFTEDFNGTTYSPSNFTGDFNGTTYVPPNTTYSENVTQILYSTEITTETSNSPGLSSTVSEPDACKDYCQNGGTCLVTKDGAECSCPYPYSGKTCKESQWCTEGLGKTLCPGDSCLFNFTSRIGRCDCPKDHYFNYEKKTCELIDKCAVTQKTCTGKNEVCKNGACECPENFKMNDKKECVPNFCNAETYPCSEHELCEDIVADPGNVKCACDEGFLFDGKTCIKSGKCTLPGTLGCQHVCNADTERCECKPGFTLLSNNKTCVLTDAGSSCKKSCGVGVCVKISQGEVCICPRTHISRSTCIDLCAAKSIPVGVCPNNECVSDDKLGYKCKCEGKLTLDQNGVTCRRKLMCSEGKSSEICKKKNAHCVEDFDKEEGFRCDCKKGEEPDTDGVCKSKCALKQHRDRCSKLLATCDMDGLEVICKCPPMLTFNKDDGKCIDLAKASYTAMLPIASQKTDVSPKSASDTSFAEKKQIVVDIFKVTTDVRAAMHQLYGENYQFTDVLSCVISSGEMNCLVEMQFQSDPKDQINLISDPNTCLPIDADTCLIPPGLVLAKKDIKPDMFTVTDPCSKDIKERNCGVATQCKKVNSDTNNFECTCSAGFSTYGYYQPLSDERTIIHNCQDIDECLKPRACPNRTRCLNTYGSYECPCQSGFKPLTETADTKASGCVEICNAKMCGHGKCEVKGDLYRCQCDAGYRGLNCDKDEPFTAGPAGMKVALIILSTLVVPFVLLSVYMVYKYHLLKKQTYKTNYLDDQSSTINLQPLRNSGSRHNSRFT